MKRQDELFRAAMQRLSNTTGLSIGVDVEWLDKKKIANDGSEDSYKSDDWRLYFINQHDEQQIFLAGKKEFVTKMMDAMNMVFEASADLNTGYAPQGFVSKQKIKPTDIRVLMIGGLQNKSPVGPG